VSQSSTVLIEIFATPHCTRCQGAKKLVESLAQELASDALQWRDVNVIDEIDYAVQLGVIATPAIAVNGKLVFTCLPSKPALKKWIQQHLTDND